MLRSEEPVSRLEVPSYRKGVSDGGQTLQRFRPLIWACQVAESTEGHTARGDQGHLMIRDRIIP